MIPQLRVRSEYSFRSCYGRVPEVAARLEEIGCEAAGLVDTRGTWGHLDWAKNLGSKALYGAEFVLPTEPGQPKPRYWALATDMAGFYRFSSEPPATMEELADAQHVVRFAGAALTDPSTFDYIDLNPRSALANRAALRLAENTGKPLVLCSDNDYPGPGDRDAFLAWDDSKKMTPQHILSDEELRAQFSWLDGPTLEQAIYNTHRAAERCSGLAPASAPMISVPGDLGALIAEGKAHRLRRGHIKNWTPEYTDRLAREEAMIANKGYASYFIVVAEMVAWAKARMLVGPARGSSAGSLACYLLGITEVDPLVHGLLFERFIDLNRDDLPDIDIDFNDQKRETVFEHLAQKYGAANIARIGSISRLKPRSVVAHVGKKLGIPTGAGFKVLNVLIEYSSGDARFGKGLEDTLENTQPGRAFMKQYPEAVLMTQLEEHASHTGQHAAGIIVSQAPVTDFCTVRDGIAQLDKKGAERINLLKIDALGLRTLGVLEDAGVLSAEEFYDMALDDPEVFKVLNDRRFSGVFQFEGAAQRRVSAQIKVDAFQRIDHITALARPGPLGGGAANTYINRAAGREPVAYVHPSMESYLAETHGVVLYQEQVMRIVRELGQFSWEDTSTIRKAMSGRKGREFFDQHGERFASGAAKLGISEADAHEIWESICSFGAWGMNKSHTTSYAVISYWCAWMKAYHPEAYAASCLRNAKDAEQQLEVLRDLQREGTPFVAFDVNKSRENWHAENGMLYGGFSNLVGVGPVKARAWVEKRDAGELTDKDIEKLSAMKPRVEDLKEGHTRWGGIYADPGAHNVRGRVSQFTELQDRASGCVIAKLIKQQRRDENEDRRVVRRGNVMEGPTLFLDMFVVDDSVSQPVTARIKIPLWESIGERVADHAMPGDWFLMRGYWLEDFSMLLVEKIKSLTNEELKSL
jgi:DNA-directed DNA polymerase III PolC